MAPQRLVGVEIPLVRGDPIRGNLALRGRQIEFAAANLIVKVIFQLILPVRIPLGGIRFRPQVANVVAASSLREIQVKPIDGVRSDSQQEINREQERPGRNTYMRPSIFASNSLWSTGDRPT
jgi:hypothetical protein